MVEGGCRISQPAVLHSKCQSFNSEMLGADLGYSEPVYNRMVLATFLSDISSNTFTPSGSLLPQQDRSPLDQTLLASSPDTVSLCFCRAVFMYASMLFLNSIDKDHICSLWKIWKIQKKT